MKKVIEAITSNNLNLLKTSISEVLNKKKAELFEVKKIAVASEIFNKAK